MAQHRRVIFPGQGYSWNIGTLIRGQHCTYFGQGGRMVWKESEASYSCKKEKPSLNRGGHLRYNHCQSNSQPRPSGLNDHDNDPTEVKPGTAHQPVRAEEALWIRGKMFSSFYDQVQFPLIQSSLGNKNNRQLKSTPNIFLSCELTAFCTETSPTVNIPTAEVNLVTEVDQHPLSTDVQLLSVPATLFETLWPECWSAIRRHSRSI